MSAARQPLLPTKTIMTYRPHNKAIFYGTKALLPFTALNLVFTAGYGGKYSAEGTNRLLNIIHIDASGVGTTVGVVSFFSTNYTNLTSSGWSDAPKDIDAWMHSLLHPPAGSVKAWFANTFASRGNFLNAAYNGTVHSLYSIAFVAGTYMGLEPIKEILGAWFGTYGALIPLTLLGLGGLISYAHPYGPRCIKYMQHYKEGIKSWIKGEPAILRRVRNHHSPLIEIEIHLEALTNPACRAFLSSFSFLRLAEQWGLPTVILVPLGGTSGMVLALLVFTPKLLEEYHQHFDIPEDKGGPVTQEERNAMFTEIYGKMSRYNRAKIESKRLFIFGLAQGGLTLYYALTWASPWVQEKLIEYGVEERRANLISSYLLIGGTLGFCVYASSRASLYKELNKVALANREMKCTEIIVNTIPPQSLRRTSEREQQQGYGSIPSDQQDNPDSQISPSVKKFSSTALILSNALQIPALFISADQHMPEKDAAIFSLTAGSVNAQSRIVSWEEETIKQTDKLFKNLSACSLFKSTDDEKPRPSFCDSVRNFFKRR